MSAIERAFCRSAPWASFARRVVLPWVLEGHELRSDLLEIGCGSGAMANGVARRFPSVRLTTTDIDAVMVTVARTRLSHHKNVTVEQADVTALPYADASFEAVTSYLMLHHVIRWQDALAEASRVLRPGGMFIGYDMTDTRIARLIHRLDGSPHRMIAGAELYEGLGIAGFTGVGVRASAFGHLMRFHARKSTEE